MKTSIGFTSFSNENKSPTKTHNLLKNTIFTTNESNNSTCLFGEKDTNAPQKNEFNQDKIKNFSRNRNSNSKNHSHF